MPTFEFIFTDDHYLQIILRRRQCSKIARWIYVFRMLLAIPMAFLVYTGIKEGHYLLSALLSIIVVYLIFSRPVDRWFMLRTFRRSPYRNEELKIRLTEENFTGEGTVGSTTLGWDAFIRAVRSEGGFLLFQGPGLSNWLPLGTMTEGTPDEAATLIQSKIADYKTRQGLVATAENNTTGFRVARRRQ